MFKRYISQSVIYNGGKNMSLTIHNYKLSIKIPCIELSILEKAFPGKKKVYRNYFVTSDNNYSFTFFKHCSQKNHSKNQHLNVTSIKKNDDIPDVINHLSTRINIPKEHITYKIDNVSATLQLEKPLDIEKFQFLNQDLKMQYNNEKFPGLFIKKKQQNNVHAKAATFILFTSGKINIVGARSLEAVEESARWVTERCAPMMIE